jgi:hypothetical protein
MRFTGLDARREHEGHWQFAEGAGAELDDLAEALGLVGLRQSGGRVVKPSRTWGGGDVEVGPLANLSPTVIGRDLYDLMRLAEVPEREKEAVLALLERKTQP